MSLISDPPHVVTIALEEEAVDSRGNAIRRPSTTTVEVRCRVQPLSSGGRRENAPDVPSDRDLYHLTCPPGTPLGRWSTVAWARAGGAPEDLLRFTVQAGPDVHDQSPATARVTATLLRVA